VCVRSSVLGGARLLVSHIVTLYACSILGDGAHTSSATYAGEIRSRLLNIVMTVKVAYGSPNCQCILESPKVLVRLHNGNPEQAGADRLIHVRICQ
jgi:hypothetical protein